MWRGSVQVLPPWQCICAVLGLRVDSWLNERWEYILVAGLRSHKSKRFGSDLKDLDQTWSGTGSLTLTTAHLFKDSTNLILWNAELWSLFKDALTRNHRWAQGRYPLTLIGTAYFTPYLLLRRGLIKLPKRLYNKVPINGSVAFYITFSRFIVFAKIVSWTLLGKLKLGKNL
jgi:hypothetical protein